MLPENRPTSSVPTSTPAAATVRTRNEEESKRKRTAIGLSPRRPTARPTVQRPPRDLFSTTQGWLLTLLLCSLLVSTALLTAARLNNAPTAWPIVRSYWRAIVTGESWSGPFDLYSTRPDYQLQVNDPFTERTGLVACTQQAGEWSTDVIPEAGVYRMQVWPGRLTWSTIALENNNTYRVEASIVITTPTPDSYSGFIGRYQRPTDFYLFLVDGHARYQVQLWQDGLLTTLQPWTESPLLNRAGGENLLALEDTGTQLNFYANGSALLTVPTPALPNGDVGLLAGAGETSMAEIDVDWLRVYQRVP